MSTSILCAQKAIVSTKQTKILYEWIDNELEIMIENYSCKNIVAKVDKGKLIDNDCNYIYQSNGYGIREVKIIVGIKSTKGIKWIDSFSIRVKPLPEPWVLFGMSTTSSGDSISKNVILFFPNFIIPDSDPICLKIVNDENKKIIEHHLKIVRNDTVIYSEFHNIID